MSSKRERYEALVSAYSTDLYRYAYWRCRDAQCAEDLVQETFMRAWRFLHTLKNDKAAKSWLFTILRNEHARMYESYTPDFADDFDFDLVADEALSNEDTQVVRRALAMLADEYREPLVLQVVGGYSCKEIAEMLGLTPGAVMTRVFRARRQLMSVLEGRVVEDDLIQGQQL